MSPFRSKKQMRFLAANVKSTLGGWKQFHEWAKSTPSIAKLPEKAPQKKEEK